MKQTLLFALCLALTGILRAQSSNEGVGINTLDPLHPVHIQQVEGNELADLEPVVKIEYTGTNPDQVIAVSGHSTPQDAAGIGGFFQGGFMGVYGRVISTGDLTYNALAGHITGSGAGNNTAVRGHAEGTGTKYGLSGSVVGEGTNYGLYASAEGGSTNWAGYFTEGDVFIQNRMGIGTLSPSVELDVSGSIKIADGTQGPGKILTSDASGVATWQSPPAPSPVNYPSVSICCMTFMTKNLDVATYRNGDTIPKVTDPAAWASLTTGAYCYYNNDSTTYAAVYGKLYNWYAVNDPRGLAPEGWHIPTYIEINALAECLGDLFVTGGYLKETGLSHWSSPNTGATNYAGFTALPAGYRDDENGTFSGLGTATNWWSSTPYEPSGAYYFGVNHNTTILNANSSTSPRFGFSVRCIKD